jgi:FixJ family two-component response regulator
VIAVLDDEDSVCKALVRVLRAGGFAARGFHSPEEFLKTWRSDLPDCLLLDLQMPGLSGQEVQQALNAAGAQFPILIVTVNSAPRIREECMRLGAADYLCKPLDVPNLLQAVTSATDSSGRLKICQ